MVVNRVGDCWGNRFKYHVTTPELTTSDNGICGGAVVDLDLCQAGDITILTRGDDIDTGGTIESKFEYNAATFVPAVVVNMH